MAQSGIVLRESLAQVARDGEPHTTDRETSTSHQGDLRERESNVQKARVLLGSAILQLPIWGKIGRCSQIRNCSLCQVSP
jgi:hypothetical protein